MQKINILQLKPPKSLWEEVAEYAKHCSWLAGRMLAKKMQKKDFHEWERVFIALEEGRIAGYCTLTKEDSIPDVANTPYIGYVFVGRCTGEKDTARS